MPFSVDSPLPHLTVMAVLCVSIEKKGQPELFEVVRAFYPLTIEKDRWHCLPSS